MRAKYEGRNLMTVDLSERRIDFEFENEHVMRLETRTERWSLCAACCSLVFDWGISDWTPCVERCGLDREWWMEPGGRNPVSVYSAVSATDFWVDGHNCFDL